MGDPGHGDQIMSKGVLVIYNSWTAFDKGILHLTESKKKKEKRSCFNLQQGSSTLLSLAVLQILKLIIKNSST